MTHTSPNWCLVASLCGWDLVGCRFGEDKSQNRSLEDTGLITEPVLFMWRCQPKQGKIHRGHRPCLCTLDKTWRCTVLVTASCTVSVRCYFEKRGNLFCHVGPGNQLPPLFFQLAPTFIQTSVHPYVASNYSP